MKPVTNSMVNLNGKGNKISAILLKIFSICKNRQQIAPVCKYIQVKAGKRSPLSLMAVRNSSWLFTAFVNI